MSGSLRALKSLVDGHTFEKLSFPTIPLMTSEGVRLSIPEDGYLKLKSHVEKTHETNDLSLLSIDELNQAIRDTKTKLTRYFSAEQREALVLQEANKDKPWENLMNRSGHTLPTDGTVSGIVLNNNDIYVHQKIDPVAGDFSGKIQKSPLAEAAVLARADCEGICASRGFKRKKIANSFVASARKKMTVAAVAAAPKDSKLEAVLHVSEGRVKANIPGTIGLNHSSFFAGEDVQFAGSVFYVEDQGWVLENKTGHYRTNAQSFVPVLEALEAKGYDLSQLSILARFLKPGLKPAGCGELGKYDFELRNAFEYLQAYRTLDAVRTSPTSATSFCCAPLAVSPVTVSPASVSPASVSAIQTDFLPVRREALVMGEKTSLPVSGYSYTAESAAGGGCSIVE